MVGGDAQCGPGRRAEDLCVRVQRQYGFHGSRQRSGGLGIPPIWDAPTARHPGGAGDQVFR